MKWFIAAAAVILPASTLSAQEFDANKLPDAAYNSLLEAQDVNAVVKSPALDFWWTQRRKTREELMEHIPEFGRTIGIERLSYESLLNRVVRGGYVAEQELYGDNVREFATLLVSGEKSDRQEFLDAMRLVESQDLMIRREFNPKRPESIIPVRAWATVRGQYALHIAATASVFRATNSPNCQLTVHTIDRMRNETSGYDVVYVPAFWRGVPKMERVFPRPSSPTSHDIRAGYYFIRCRRTTDLVDGPERSIDVDRARVDTTVFVP